MGLLTSRLGGWVLLAGILALLGGGLALHMRATAHSLAALTKQVTTLTMQGQSLQAANDAMQADIADVAQAQRNADDQITATRERAATDSRGVASRVFDPHNAALQVQINKEIADTFKRLELDSRAH